MNVTQTFQQVFHHAPVFTVRSPGRVNIIGEHTDYNEGFVLPAAIDKAIYVAVGKREDDAIHLWSCDFNEAFSCSMADVKPASLPWVNYVLGVVDQLKKNGFQPGGFNLVLGGDVPIGAGLSSSAAVECATIFALNRLFQFNIKRLDMVKMAQKAEHTYAGVLCGIMDQFASMFGKKDFVIKLDCRTLEYEHVPLAMQGYKILLLNTNVKHSLSSTAYNTRRQQCEQGVAWVKEFHPQVNSLRDITLEMLDQHVAGQDALIYKRCRYVVEENQRLLQGCEDLKNGDLPALGKKMFRTHEGLSKAYEVSCPELDFLANFVKNKPEVLGARMMGGGFGGCTINLVREDAIEPLIKVAGEAFHREFEHDLTAYVAQIEDGTGIF
jgi:galactokinase